jgi:hypothetical protein
VLPFALLDPALIVLPIHIVKNRPVLLSEDELNALGDREFAKWMKQVNSIWLEKRGKKADNGSASEWLDYQGKLSNQDSTLPHLVLYNAAGTNVSAAYYDRQSGTLPFIVEHKLYWAAFATAEEALYLTALLNSETANERIKPFQSMGLMGERDIEKKLLDLPIPLFKASNPAHIDLARIGAEASAKTAELLKKVELPTQLSKRRELVRGHLSQLMSQINDLTSKVLGA